MRLIQIGGTQARELQLPNGDAVLFSYAVPVAYKGSMLNCRTGHLWGVTTERHIRDWGAADFLLVPQVWFNKLTLGVGE